MWYSQGTVAVTSGGTNITGTGTSFLTNARVGDGITITGSTALHEIIGVTSNTQLSIRPAYAGTTGSGRAYGISPLLGYDKDLSDAFNQLRLQFGDQLSNLQPWASASTANEAREELGVNNLSERQVTTSTGTQTVAEALDQRGLVFDSVADMRAAANLTVGTKVRTLGYYSPGDGGGNDYEIVAAGTGTDDGGSFIELVAIGLQSKGIFVDEAVNVRQFGAVGDGITDDRDALLAALRAAQGREVTLEPGEVYRVSGTLHYSGDVSLVCRGFPKAQIYEDGQDFRVVRFDSPISFTRTLVSNTEINNHYWEVDNGGGIEPGMLVEVVSSKAWHWPENVDARKSELNKVAAVDGNLVRAERPSNDGYNLESESVEVRFYNPIKVRLENIEFRLSHVPGERHGALWVESADSPLIIDCDFINGSSNGINLNRCYGGLILRGEIRGTNGSMGSTGAVYAVQMQGCTDTWVDGTTFRENYAGINITGQQVISINCGGRNTVVTGGGVSNEGLVFGWDRFGVQVRNQRGHGSRGPSDGSKFHDNIFYHMPSALVMRGRNVVVQNNHFHGRYIGGCIKMFHGANAVIRGNTMDPSFFIGKESFTWDGGNITNHLPESFVRIESTWQYDQRHPVVIADNRVSVCQSFIDVLDPGTSVFLTIANNDIRMYADPATETLPLVRNVGATPVTLSGTSSIQVVPLPDIGPYARMKLFSEDIELNIGFKIYGWSERYQPEYIGGNGWDDPTIYEAWLTINGEYAEVDLMISGGTITTTDGEAYSARFSLPYVSSLSSTSDVRGVATGVGRSGGLSAHTATNSAQLSLVNDGSTNAVRVIAKYRIS